MGASLDTFATINTAGFRDPGLAIADPDRFSRTFFYTIRTADTEVLIESD